MINLTIYFLFLYVTQHSKDKLSSFLTSFVPSFWFFAPRLSRSWTHRQNWIMWKSRKITTSTPALTICCRGHVNLELVLLGKCSGVWWTGWRQTGIPPYNAAATMYVTIRHTNVLDQPPPPCIKYPVYGPLWFEEDIFPKVLVETLVYDKADEDTADDIFRKSIQRRFSSAGLLLIPRVNSHVGIKAFYIVTPTLFGFRALPSWDLCASDVNHLRHWRMHVRTSMSVQWYLMHPVRRGLLTSLSQLLAKIPPILAFFINAPVT